MPIFMPSWTRCRKAQSKTQSEFLNIYRFGLRSRRQRRSECDKSGRNRWNGCAGQCDPEQLAVGVVAVVSIQLLDTVSMDIPGGKMILRSMIPITSSKVKKMS